MPSSAPQGPVHELGRRSTALRDEEPRPHPFVHGAVVGLGLSATVWLALLVVLALVL